MRQGASSGALGQIGTITIGPHLSPPVTIAIERLAAQLKIEIEALLYLKDK